MSGPVRSTDGIHFSDVAGELPDLKGREEILKDHAKKIKVPSDVDFHIIARMAAGTSGALGYTMQVEQQDQSLLTKNELENKIAIYTGGRAVEEIVSQPLWYEKAKQILRDNRDKLDQLAQYLYEKETITGEEFEYKRKPPKGGLKEERSVHGLTCYLQERLCEDISLKHLF